jgi:restriction system protein
VTLADRPLYRELFWPTLRAIQELGGSATRQEVLAKVASPFSEDEQAETMPNGRTSRLHYYTSWNLTRLKRVGAIDNSKQGVWTLTERGRGIGEGDADALWEEMRAAYRKLRMQRLRAGDEEEGDLPGGEEAGDDDATSDSWKDELLSRIKALTPAAFERLCQRLLREAHVEQVRVLGGAGDQGIDGVGRVRLGLLSFPVYFQAKKYDKTVTPSAVRDFRGTMAGRGEKGLLITTASFTPAAYSEATRDGVTPIDLIDGNELCDLLKRHGVGVNVTERTVEDVTVDDTFWDTFA